MYSPAECRLRQRARSCETPSGNRPRGGPPDRPHRPATRRDPELLPVSRAAELLSRSACCAWRERPFAPQAVWVYDGFRGRFEHPGNRPTATGCGSYRMVRRYARGPHPCRDQQFEAFLNDFRCIRHLSIIHTEASDHNIQITGLPNSGRLNDNYSLYRACDASLKIKSTSITRNHSGVPIWGVATRPRAKMWHAIKSGCSSSAFEERCPERFNAKSDRGNKWQSYP